MTIYEDGLMPRVRWADVPGILRRAIEHREGKIASAEDVRGEAGADLAVRLKVGGGNVFVKGLRGGDPAALRREAEIATAVRTVSPALRWHESVREAGTAWQLVVFDSVTRRRPELAPGSADLTAIGRTLQVASRCRAPEPPFPLYVDRFGDLASDDDRTFLRGTAVVHGDPGQHTLRVADDRAWLTNWAAASAGPPWVDAATFAVRLISRHGFRPEDARAWLSQQNAWHAALAFGVLSFVRLHSALDPASAPHYRELLTYYV